MIDPILTYSPQPPPSPNRALSMRWQVDCERCYGAGWYPEATDDDDHLERYCDCEAGKWRRILDGSEPVYLPINCTTPGYNGTARIE